MESEIERLKKTYKCPLGLSHIPNAETIASIEASERGEGVATFESIDNLFKELELLP